MSLMVLDERVAEQLLAERRAWGGDHHDEVWDGVYMMSPLPNDEHQDIVAMLTALLVNSITLKGLGKVRPGVNVSDRDEDWRRNYRCPDVAVFLEGGRAVNRGTHWLGGPDFAAEVVSESDRSREKLPFYARVGVRELLLVERDPWSLELLRLEGDRLAPAGRSTLDEPARLVSEVLPLAFRLLPGAGRPGIEVTHAEGEGTWIL